MRILLEAFGEGSGEGILFNTSVFEQNLNYGQRHVGIVRPRPRSRRQLRRIGSRVPEKELAKGIANGEALEAAKGLV